MSVILSVAALVQSVSVILAFAPLFAALGTLSNISVNKQLIVSSIVPTIALLSIIPSIAPLIALSITPSIALSIAPSFAPSFALLVAPSSVAPSLVAPSSVALSLVVPPLVVPPFASLLPSLRTFGLGKIISVR